MSPKCRKTRMGAVITGLLVTGIIISSCALRQIQGNRHRNSSTEISRQRSSANSSVNGASDEGKSVHFTRMQSGIPAYPSADSIFIEAERQKLQGNTSKAIRLFHDFLEIKPNNATAYYELALLTGRLKNAQATLENARKAVSLDTANHWFAIAYANALAMNKHFDSAAAVFHYLAVRYPGQPEYLYNEAVMLSNADQYTDALHLFDRLQKEAGINEEFVYQKQRIFLKMGEPDSAATEIQKLIDLDPRNFRFYSLLAQVYSDDNRPDKALEVYQSMLSKYPESPRAMVAIGLLYKQKGDDSAFKHYMTAAFGNPKFDIDKKIAFVYPYLKYVEIDSTKKGEALTLCRLIVNAHPGSAKAHALYGDMFFQCNMPDSAVMEYRKTLAIDNSQYEVWNQMMLLYATTGKNDSLLHISNRAVNIFPDKAGAWYFNGMALYFSGKMQPCIKSLRQSLQLGIKDKDLNSRIYSILGEAYNDLGNYAVSDSCFQTALQLNPKDDMILNNYSYHLAERKKDLSNALQMIKAAVTLKPGRAMYEDTYAWVLFNLGKYKSAKLWMEKVLSSSGAENHPGYLDHYGDILFKNHEVTKAVKYWKMAKEKGGNEVVLNWKISKQRLPSSKTLLKLHKRKK